MNQIDSKLPDYLNVGISPKGISFNKFDKVKFSFTLKDFTRSS